MTLEASAGGEWKVRKPGWNMVDWMTEEPQLATEERGEGRGRWEERPNCRSDHGGWASQAPVYVLTPWGLGSSVDPDSGGLGQTGSLCPSDTPGKPSPLLVSRPSLSSQDLGVLGQSMTRPICEIGRLGGFWVERERGIWFVSKKPPWLLCGK